MSFNKSWKPPPNLVDKARQFAEVVHHSQKRYFSGRPYFDHLNEVAMLLAAHGQSEIIQAAGYLHDCIEDQNVEPAELHDRFGGGVSHIVEEMTEPAYGTHDERFAEYRDQLAGSIPATATVKLADIISNVSTVSRCEPKWAKRYTIEKANLMPVLRHGDADLWSLAAKNTTRALGFLGAPDHAWQIYQ